MTHPSPLSRRNAEHLIDELQTLIQATPENERSPDEHRQTKAILDALEQAPAPAEELHPQLAELRAWTETMLLQDTHAKRSGVKSGILQGLARLRGLLVEGG